jgi:predicted kinase
MGSKNLFLLRGLPGCGKSTIARLIADNDKHPVFSVDDYFTGPGGHYEFRYNENHKAYEACEKNVKEAMLSCKPKIFVHNTFTHIWEMEPYFKMAKEEGYQIHVMTVENYHGSDNIHGINTDQIRKMADKYPIKLF